MPTQDTPRLTDEELRAFEADPASAFDVGHVGRLVAELREARERNEALRAVLAAAGVTGWVTAPDGSVEPQYDTDEEEDPRITALLELAYSLYWDAGAVGPLPTLEGCIDPIVEEPLTGEPIRKSILDAADDPLADTRRALEAEVDDAVFPVDAHAIMDLADAYANARALAVWERFELGLGLLIQPPGGLPHVARVGSYLVEAVLRRIYGELAKKATIPPPPPRSTEEGKMLDIRIKTYQRHPGGDNQGVELTMPNMLPDHVLFLSVEGARKLALELIHAAFCVESGGEYDRDVGWTG